MSQPWYANHGQKIQVWTALFNTILGLIALLGNANHQWYGVIATVGLMMGLTAISSFAWYTSRLIDVMKWLSIQDIYRTEDNRSAVAYPTKIWIVIKNESDTTLRVGGAEFRTSAGGVKVTYRSDLKLRVEGTNGWQAGSWSNENREVFVHAGKSFETWIGLPSGVGVEEIRRRSLTRTLGTLIVSVERKGRQRNLTINI